MNLHSLPRSLRAMPLIWLTVSLASQSPAAEVAAAAAAAMDAVLAKPTKTSSSMESVCRANQTALGINWNAFLPMMSCGSRLSMAPASMFPVLPDRSPMSSSIYRVFQARLTGRAARAPRQSILNGMAAKYRLQAQPERSPSLWASTIPTGALERQAPRLSPMEQANCSKRNKPSLPPLLTSRPRRPI